MGDEAASDLYAENYVNPFGSGPAARVEPIRRYHAAFPDLHFAIEELIVAEETVVVRAAFRGTDTGGYVGRAATGRSWTSGWSPSCISTATRSSGSGSGPTSAASSSNWGSSTTPGPHSRAGWETRDGFPSGSPACAVTAQPRQTATWACQSMTTLVWSTGSIFTPMVAPGLTRAIAVIGTDCLMITS